MNLKEQLKKLILSEKENRHYDVYDWDELPEEITKQMQEEVHSLSRQIYRELEEEYEGLTTDEAVIETLKAREYKFTEKGIID